MAKRVMEKVVAARIADFLSLDSNQRSLPTDAAGNQDRKSVRK